MTTARLYLRRNGSWGASFDEVADTGHYIEEDSGRFTVWSIHDEDVLIANQVPQEVAEAAIVDDWEKQ